MDDEAIYCMLLKATCELKDQIDELVDKNHDKIGINFFKKSKNLNYQFSVPV